MSDYLHGLNKQQLEAVLHTDGPLMIVAGAGSGKTKVLTTRIAHLINNGIDSFRILALTFTNKAAREMKERIEKALANQEARNLYIGTFHSVFSRILRIEASRLGYPAHFTIYDTEDAKSVIKAIVKEKNLDEKLYKPAFVYNRISAAKNNLYSYKDYMSDSDIQEEDNRGNRSRIGEIFEEYTKRCFRNGAMDFDDILINTYILLTRFPEALSKYQMKFRYVMIDEYQDTNLAQYHIVKLLSAMHENICVVGDDAQSIYSFRGASLQNIFQFQKDYQDVRIIKLEQNYRSTAHILNAANKVIANNAQQIRKNLWTEKESGEKIKVVPVNTDNDEGRYVADRIAELKIRYHCANSDIAILYRTNAQSRAFEEYLRRSNIDYVIYGGLSFFQRKEIKDFVSYLRAVVNPADEEALKRIINYPVRGIGNTSINKISVYAHENNITFWEALCKPALLGFKGATHNAIENFVLMMQHFNHLLQSKNAYEVADEVGKKSGLVKELYSDKTVEGISRYENIQELLNAIKEFTETPDENGELTDKPLGEYLQQITLLTDADNEDPNNNNKVKLMTIHAAKGLEFPIVFLVGMEENIFPSFMSMYDREDLEEERRLFYVAITRAKEKLYVTYANNRYRFGTLVHNDRSRFINELPPEMIEETLLKKTLQNNTSNNSLFANNDKTIQQKKTINTNTSHVLSSQYKPVSPSQLDINMKVEHERFGFGKIISLEGASNNRIATIAFENNIGTKKIMLNYAKLSIVN